MIPGISKCLITADDVVVSSEEFQVPVATSESETMTIATDQCSGC